MYKFFATVKKTGVGLRVWPLLAVALLVGRQEVSAQPPITNASLTTLQNDLENGGGNIVLAFDGVLTTTTPLEVAFDTVIDASGHSITLNGSSQLFFVDPGVNFKVINLSMSGAQNTGATGTAGTTGGNGGSTGGSGGTGIKGDDSLGGAVHNEGNSTFINCLFLTNSATGGIGGAGGKGGNGSNTGGNGGNGGNGGAGFGGAIYNLGTILLSNCTVAGNIAVGGTGGTGGTNGTGSFTSYPGNGGAGGTSAGAGIFNVGKATIINCTFNQNEGTGGVSEPAGGNTGNGNGNNGFSGGNSWGGGIFNSGTNATNIIVNCTFFANTVLGGTGGNGGNGKNVGGNGGNGGNAMGGNVYNSSNAVISLTNCTIVGGVVTGGTNGTGGTGFPAGGSGSVGSISGANIANASGTFRLKNSILGSPTNATSASGTITDFGNNLSSDGTPTFTTTNSFGSKTLKLSPTGLAANSSATVLTIALSPGSPAIDAIYDSSAPSFDERNFPRPAGLRSDIGAFEFMSFTTNFNVSGQVTISGNAFSNVTLTAGAFTTTSDSNGFFSFSLPISNNFVIAPAHQTFFSPQSASVFVLTNTSGLLFNATNAGLTLTNVFGTNTNSFQLSFKGIPSYATYRIQATTNLATNHLVTNITWVTIATNNSGTPSGAPFIYSNTGTNVTNFPRRFFRAVTP